MATGDEPSTRRTGRSRRTAPLGAGDPARPDSGRPQAPAAGPARRLPADERPGPHAAHPAPGLALLHPHRPRRRPGVRPGPVCPAPPSPVARRTRLAHARRAQQGHVPVPRARARPPSGAGRARAPFATTRAPIHRESAAKPRLRRRRLMPAVRPQRPPALPGAHRGSGDHPPRAGAFPSPISHHSPAISPNPSRSREPSPCSSGPC